MSHQLARQRRQTISNIERKEEPAVSYGSHDEITAYTSAIFELASLSRSLWVHRPYRLLRANAPLNRDQSFVDPMMLKSQLSGPTGRADIVQRTYRQVA